MKYGLGLTLPEDYARRIRQFRLENAAWETRPMRSDPHISIKGPAGLGESQEALATIGEIAGGTRPFPIQLTSPAMFDGEPILYLGVDSPGWRRLHRDLVDTIGSRTGARMHPWEISGWIPHTTILRVKPDLTALREAIIESAARALEPFPAFEVRAIRMYRQASPEEWWNVVRDFPLG